MKPLFEYIETGEPWHWKYYILPVIALTVFILFIIIGIYQNGSLLPIILYLISSIVLVYVIFQINTLPTLSITAYPERILIENKHRSRVVQSWEIDPSIIANIEYIEESPNEKIQFNNPFMAFLQYGVLMEFTKRYHIISIKSHSSALVIESDYEILLIGIENTKFVYENLRNIYSTNGFYKIRNSRIEGPELEIRKVFHKLILLNRVSCYIFQIPMILSTESVIVFMEYYKINTLYLVMYIASYFIYYISIYHIVIKPLLRERIEPEILVLSAYKDRLVIRLRKPPGEMKTIMANQIRDISIIHVESGNYLNIPEYTEGFRFKPYSGPHDAVTIVTDTEKYAFDIPHPEEAAKALRSLYNLEPEISVE